MRDLTRPRLMQLAIADLKLAAIYAGDGATQTAAALAKRAAARLEQANLIPGLAVTLKKGVR